MNSIENYIDNLNYFFVFAEYIEEKYFNIEHADNNIIVNSSLTTEASKKKRPGIANKTNPGLWSKCKSAAKSRMGGKHSARAMQLALKLYKKRGGRFKGSKPSAKTNKMKKWTKQKWTYLSDYKKDKNKLDDQDLLLKKNFDYSEDDDNDAKGRYLPEAKWKSLSDSERAATDKKKKMQGRYKQYVSNTQKAKVKSKYKYY